MRLINLIYYVSVSQDDCNDTSFEDIPENHVEKARCDEVVELAL